jgi:hypothetical protein
VLQASAGDDMRQPSALASDINAAPQHFLPDTDPCTTYFYNACRADAA